ncbi:family 43 glycosylhydrolase [Saccharibacillus sacchari]|uniref:family 43 glycosylhydrolase n=1 Tax=Saccharibacillus sacchari TaxID=456493 RepID=UPI0004B691D0|nr:family 43 glycosylhydrolase [Saccharibacillus sacchari]
MPNRLVNGEVWTDEQGEPIHAHGGHMLWYKGFYYWYGEDRRAENYVSCYRSADLFHWEFRSHILTVNTQTEPIRVRTDLRLSNEDGSKINLERPKVLYNELTRKFVLWAHYENGKDYRAAACAIATSDRPDEGFVYHGSFNPYGYMSRDCTLFQDDNGSAYFISAARDNADLHVYRLADDYLNVDRLIRKLWQGEYREAPAVFKRNGRYYMLSSFCTGWAPNQGKYAVADSMEGDWSLLHDFGDETTYDTQPAFVLKLSENEFLYVSDRWNAQEYDRSGYVILPIHFEAEKPVLRPFEHIQLEATTGVIHFQL